MSAKKWPRLARTLFGRLVGTSSLWLWILASSMLIVLMLGFFLHGGRLGLYMDDYSVKAWAFDFHMNEWKLNLTPFDLRWNLRPLAYILEPNLANAIPQHEIIVRFGIVAIHLLNVLLLGGLIRRVTGSIFLSTLSGAYFLFPVFGNEGLLWFSAAITDVFCLVFLLVGFHLVLSCHSLGNSPRLVAGVVAWYLMIMFYESGLFTVLLLPAFFAVSRSSDLRSGQRVWGSALAASVIPIGIYLAVVERNSPSIAGRGGATLNLTFIFFQKVPEVARGFWWLLTDWGVFGPLREALKLGWREWVAVPGGPLAIGASLMGICLMALLFPVKRDTIPDSARLVKLGLIGLAWMVLGLVPIVLIRFQIVEIRTLYIPFAGVALSAAAVSGLVVNALSRWRAVAMRGLLLITGAAVLVSGLTMAGLVHAYQLRWYLDEEQVAAMGTVLSEFSRTQPLWLLPVTLDERTVGKYWGKETVLDRYLFGVFEHSWSARDAIRLKFGDREIHAVTSHHWDRLHVTSVRRSGEGQITDIVVQGEAIPIEQLVAFTYQQGEVILLDPLEINGPNRSLSAVIDLPLIARLARTGLKVEKAQFQLDRQD